MGYQVLARKWRPRSFAELVGQTHVLQALVNALDQNRLHHAYLFTGTRGVGKTTIARIFAKCLNCESGVSSTPCGECPACREIDEGRFVDLIEVDAASRTKVEDTRELLDNVQYAPTRGRYKVYLIDEVHMLSTHSFNALLKTLEEPPPHVKFLLATTDPQKLPVTILSRCLQFALKNMTPERIVGHLEAVLAGEDVKYDQPALWQLARAADGSMRDALSLTDQAIAFGNGRVNESEVSVMLGTIDQGQVMKMVQALASASAVDILNAVSGLAEFAPDYLSVLDDMLSVLHRVAIAQAVPEAVDNSQGDRAQVLQLASAMTAEDVQLYYQVGLVGKKDLSLAPDPRSGFEMAMLRMLAFRPDVGPVEGSCVSGQGREQQVASEVNDPVPAAEPEPDPGQSTGKAETVPSDHHIAEAESKAEEKVPEPLPVREEIPLSAYDDLEPAGMSAPEAYNDAGTPLAVQSEAEIMMPPPAVGEEVHIEAGSGYIAPDVRLAEGQRVELGQLDPGHWIAVFRSLSLGGVTGTIGSHCEYVEQSNDELRLRLDSQRSTLYNEMHRGRIEQVLSDYFGRPLKLHVDIGVIQTETPAGWRERKIRERLQQARDSIYSDPYVQGLVTDFSANVLEQSIVPIGDVIN
ncbi:DNA polymerase III subunit gamma/tau [Endozoicomonas sp. Mp262]